MGNRRLPTAIKAAKGTLRKDRTNPNEPNYVLLHEIPDPPDFLSEEGRRIYYSTAEELLQLGTLTKIALPIFIMYCQECATYLKAKSELEKAPYIIKSGAGEPKRNPWLAIANDALVNSIRLAGEFGITPATSGKVTATKTLVNDPKQPKLQKWANYGK